MPKYKIRQHETWVLETIVEAPTEEEAAIAFRYGDEAWEGERGAICLAIEKAQDSIRESGGSTRLEFDDDADRSLVVELVKE